MTILDKIIASKKEEVAFRKDAMPIEELEQSKYFERTCFSLKQALSAPHSSGIIAEFKRRSPSKGIINDTVQIKEVTAGYVSAGAAALSVLTDKHYFGGEIQDLVFARETNNCPILRKDFIIDEYQIFEAKAHGADIILLIAEALDAGQVHDLAALAKETGLEILLELHSEKELPKICKCIDAVGVNNRNLTDFTVDIKRSEELSKSISYDFIKVSESGISDPAIVKHLRSFGFKGFLIGEQFMKTNDPAKACREFITATR